MATYPPALAKQTEINAAVSEIVRSMAPDVVRIRFNIDEDWSGKWAIFFRVLLSDEAAEKRLFDVAQEVERRLDERLDFAAMGLFAYHNFRTAGEQAVLQEKTWD